MNVVDLPYLRPRRKDIFIRLPPKIQEIILQKLNLPDVMACCQVSKSWNKIISSKKIVWETFCKTSSFNYRMVENEANTRCKEWFLFMKRREAKAKADGPKLYFLRPNDLQCNSERTKITAVHVHESFIAIATVKNSMQVFKFSESAVRILEVNHTRNQQEIFRLRTDGIIVAALYSGGAVVAWNIKNGHRIATHESLLHPYCFDLYKNTLNVAFGGWRYVAITNIGSHQTFKAETNQRTSVENVVANSEYSGIPDSESQTLWLFGSDYKYVFVFKITASLTSSPEIKSLTLLHTIALRRYSACCENISLCYDGSKYLYYLHRSFQIVSVQTITKLDIATGQVMEIMTLPQTMYVGKILGAGKEILLFIGRDFYSKNYHSMDILLHAATSSLKKYCVLFRIACKFTDFVDLANSPFIGETKWLNGVDESNDRGLICGYLFKERVMRLVYIPQRLN